MILLWVALAVLALAFIVYGYRPAERVRFRHIPGPSPMWMFGNLAEIVKMGKHEAFRHWARSYGGIFKIMEGGIVSVVIEDPKIGRQVWVTSRMNNRHPIPYMETGEDEKFNQGLILFSRGLHHRTLRAAWQPMFHSGSLSGFQTLMQAAADKLCSILDVSADTGKPDDIWRRLGDVTFQISGTAAFGVDIPAQDQMAENGSSSAIAASAKDFFEAAGQIEGIYALLQVTFPQLAPAVRQLASVLPTPTYAAGLKGRHVVQAKVTELLQEHRKTKPVSVEKERRKTEQASSGVAPGSFLDMMSKSVNKDTGLQFSDLDVVCQAFSFVMAGYETTSASMSFAIYLLSTHPEAEAKLLEEIDAFGRSRIPSYTDVTDGKTFPYLEAVFKETLRLYPVVPLTIREADKDLRLGKYDVPAGTHLAVSLYGMQRSPENWTNPDEFIPERFLPNHPAAQGCNLDAYMPFGDGPRACIGMKFAWQEAMVVLVRLYQKFTFRMTPGQVPLEVRMSLSLTPKHGVVVTCKKR